MKLKFTHKEFSLLIGIVVALIIVFTLWLRPISTEPGEVKILPQPSAPSSTVLLEKVAIALYDSFR